MARDAAVRKPVRIAKSRTLITLRDVRCIFHMACVLYFVRVWMWHLSRHAKVLAGWEEFGWFFRYLTFCSFTLQSLQLFSATLVDLSKPGTKFKLKRDSDDLSCTVFATASTVTLMYYSLQIITAGNVDEGETRVVWVGNTVHIINSVVAWLDVLISSPRRFTARARLWTLMFSVTYVMWINVVRLQTGKFPYPFLDALPYPYGILGVGFVGALVMRIFTYLGKSVSYCGKLIFGEFEEVDPVWKIEEKAEAVKVRRKQELPKELYEDIKVE